MDAIGKYAVCVLSRCDSSGEVTDGMRTLEGKLNYLGMTAAPAKSTFGDGLRHRDHEFFREVCFILIEHFKPFLSVSLLDKVSFEKLFLFDSSTIRLFSEVMKGVGRNPKNEGKKKVGLKVHMLVDAHSDTPEFVRISEAKSHDQHFVKYLSLLKHSMIVFDRAYNHYLQIARFTQNEVSFVCRLKKNAVYEVVEETITQRLNEEESGVLKAKSKTQKAFSTIAALIRIHLISNLELFWMIENSRRTYTKRPKSKNKSPCIQTELF